MKKLLTLVISIILLCACSTRKSETYYSDTYYSDTFRSLLKDVLSDTSELTIDQLEKLDIILDSLYDRIQNTTDLNVVYEAKLISLELSSNVITRGVPDLNRLGDIVEKMGTIQFEFWMDENDGDIKFDLPSVFFVRNHQDEYFYDMFWVAIHLDKTTKECNRIKCSSPFCFSKPQKKPFFDMILMNGLDKETMTSVEPMTIEFDQKGDCWVAEFDKNILDTILEYDRAFFQIYYLDDVENLESSLVNLSWFKRQYASVVGDSILINRSQSN